MTNYPTTPSSKISEIVSSGKLRRLEHVDQEKERVIDMFKNIHGVGQVTAQQYYAQVGLHHSHWLIHSCDLLMCGYKVLRSFLMVSFS